MFSERFDRALCFTHELHRRQRRKTSGVPYIAHPLSVAALVIEDGGTEDEATAALLHDSLEDQGRHYRGGAPALAAEIETRFGAEVRRLVEGLTERPYPEEQGITDRRERWRAHKLAYMAQVRAAGAGARRISCADSLHNVRSLVHDYRRMGDAIWERFLTHSGEDQAWAYGAAAKAFQAADVGPMADELAAAVRELVELMSLRTA